MKEMQARSPRWLLPALLFLWVAGERAVCAQSAAELESQIAAIPIESDAPGAGPVSKQPRWVREQDLYNALVRLREQHPEAARSLAGRIETLEGSAQKRCTIAAVLGGQEGAAYLEKAWTAGLANPATVVRCLVEAAHRDALAALQAAPPPGDPAVAAGTIRLLKQGCSSVLRYAAGSVWCYYLEHGLPALAEGRPPEYFRSPAIEVLLRRGADPLGGPADASWVRGLFGCPDPHYAQALERRVLAGNGGDGAAAAIHALWSSDARRAVPAVCLFALNECAYEYQQVTNLAWAASALGRSGTPASAHALVRVLATRNAVREIDLRDLGARESVAATALDSLVRVTGQQSAGPANSLESQIAAVERWDAALREGGVPVLDPNWDRNSPMVRALEQAYASQPVSRALENLRTGGR